MVIYFNGSADKKMDPQRMEFQNEMKFTFPHSTILIFAPMQTRLVLPLTCILRFLALCVFSLRWRCRNSKLLYYHLRAQTKITFKMKMYFGNRGMVYARANVHAFGLR